MIRLLKTKLVNMIIRGIISNIDDSTSTQILQCKLFKGVVANGVERLQEYGMTSKPLAGAQALVLSPGGNRDQAVVTKVFDRRYRPTNLVDGEVCFYDYLGSKIYLRAGGIVEITAPTQVLINSILTVAQDIATTENVTAVKNITAGINIISTNGNIEAVAGDVSDKVGTIAEMRTLFNSHTHICTAPGSPSATPVPTM